MAIPSHNVTLLVDHEACLVDIYFTSTLVLAHQELNEAITVAIKNSHDLLQLKCLAIIVEKFWHETSELSELSKVESLNSKLINYAAILVYKETLERYKTTKLIDMAACTLGFLETQWILTVVVEECAKHFKWAEVELFDSIWHGDVATLIQILPCKYCASCDSVDYVSRFRVDQVAVLVDRSTIAVRASLASRVVFSWHNYIAFLISTQIAQNIDFVEVSSLKVLVMNLGDVEGTCFIRGVHQAQSLGAWLGCAVATQSTNRFLYGNCIILSNQFSCVQTSSFRLRYWLRFRFSFCDTLRYEPNSFLAGLKRCLSIELSR